MHEEKQETEREHFDFEKSSEAVGVDKESQQLSAFDEGIHDDEGDMEQQLNPEAAEFVPVSPPTSAPHSPFSNGASTIIGNRPDLLEDDLLAQSPRKSVAPAMEDFTLPSENDFSEISKRPSELLSTTPTGLNGDPVPRPGSSSSQCSYQEMNLKEAMHGDEKQEFAAEVSDAIASNPEASPSGIDLLQGDHIASDAVRPLEQNPMHMSFYNDRNENDLPQSNPFAEPEVDMNAVQVLPDSDDEAMSDREIYDAMISNPGAGSNGFHQLDQPEIDTHVTLSTSGDQSHMVNQETPVAESELIAIGEATPITQVVQEMASEVTAILDEFQDHHQNAEQPAVEFDIKDLSSGAVADVINKSDLSPEAREFNPNQLHDEFATSPPLEPETVVPSVDDPAAVEPVEVPIASAVVAEPEELKVDVLAAAGVATATAIAAAAVATAKSPTQAKEPKVTSATKKPTTTAAKKPTSAPLKATTKPAATTARTSATSPTKTLASRATTAAPKPPLRTVKTALEKKTTAPVTAAAKKPTTNGVAPTAVKKTATTTSTTAKSTLGAAPKPAVHATKTTTLRTATAASSAVPAKTVTKPTTTIASARVPLSAR